jgi:hypothetical protein
MAQLFWRKKSYSADQIRQAIIQTTPKIAKEDAGK